MAEKLEFLASSSLPRLGVCRSKFGCLPRVLCVLCLNAFLAPIGWASDSTSRPVALAATQVVLKQGATRRLLVSRVMGVRSLNTSIVLVERDPLSGALRLRGVSPGVAKVVVSFWDTGASEEVSVRVTRLTKSKAVNKKSKNGAEKLRVFEMPGW